MPKFKLSITRVCFGEAEVTANTKEEAIQKFNERKEDYFEDYSEDYPVDWQVNEVEEIDEENENQYYQDYIKHGRCE